MKFNVIEWIDSLPKDEAYRLMNEECANTLYNVLSGHEFDVEQEYLLKDDVVKKLTQSRELQEAYLENWYKRETTKMHFDVLKSNRDYYRNFADVFAARVTIKNWEKTKQIYRFKDDLIDKLNLTDIEEYDSSYFNRLPYKDMLILFDKEIYEIIGCFVHINNNSHFSKYVGSTISLYYIYNQENRYLKNILPAMADCITFTDSLKKFQDMSGLTGSDELSINTEKLILNCLMFINAGNSSTLDSRVVYKRKEYNKKKHKEIKHDIIINESRLIVKTRYYGYNKSYNNSDYNKGNGKSPTPHIRRGHWHHHWIGPKGNQELVPMWHEPIMVGMVGEDNNTNIITNNIPTEEFSNKFSLKENKT